MEMVKGVVFCRRLFLWFFPCTIVNANGCFVLIGRAPYANFKKIMENQNFKGVSSLRFAFIHGNSSISDDELTVAMTMSKYAITRLAEEQELSY